MPRALGSLALILFACSPAWSADFVWPGDGRVTSTHFDKRNYGTHGGVDLAGPWRQPITAARDGQVKQAGFSGGFGRLVIVQHEGGYQTYYAHLQRVAVKAGQTVKAGDELGAQGATGNAQGEHLHFEVRRDGRKLVVPTGRVSGILRGTALPGEYPGLVPERRARLVSFQVPDRMEAGAEASCWAEFENTGSRPFDAQATRLGPEAPRDRLSPFRHADWLGETRPAAAGVGTPPGQRLRMAFKLRAPAVAQVSDFAEAFNLVHEAVGWFGDESRLTARIRVTPRPQPRLRLEARAERGWVPLRTQREVGRTNLALTLRNDGDQGTGWVFVGAYDARGQRAFAWSWGLASRASRELKLRLPLGVKAQDVTLRSWHWKDGRWQAGGRARVTGVMGVMGAGGGGGGGAW